MPSDIQTLMLDEIRRLGKKVDQIPQDLGDKIDDLTKAFHEHEISVERRFATQDKDIHEIKFKSGLFGTMGGVLSTIGLSLLRGLTKD